MNIYTNRYCGVSEHINTPSGLWKSGQCPRGKTDIQVKPFKFGE